MGSHGHFRVALVAGTFSAALVLSLVWFLGEPTLLGGFTIGLGSAVSAALCARVLSRTVASNPHGESGPAETEFLGGVSHEIRTPLNGILGLTQLLLRMQPGPREREYLEMIKSSGDALLRLLNEILDYSKIRAGKLRLESETFSLSKIVRQTVMTVAPQAHLKDLELLYWVEPDVCDPVVGDPSRLRQVLSNLIVNAIKFTEEGEILVDVRGEPSPEERTCVRFAVTDTGIGIPEGSRDRIFQAFAQGDGPPGYQYGGVGLGLTISRELVDAMGGTIDVESEVGRGSTFHFTIPFLTAEGDEVDKDPLPTEFSEGLKALVVDDSPGHRAILSRQLRTWGVEVVAVGGRDGAFRAIDEAETSRAPFSLLLLDSRIRGLDIWEFATELKERAPIPGVLMIFSHEHIDPAELRSRGLLGQLAKPIAPSHLSRAIEIIRRGATVDKPEDVQTNGMDRLVLGGLRVLFAEDNPVNRTVVVRMLEKSGSHVVAAADGPSAIERWERERFDILILDVEMPDKDGLEVAREIRARESGTEAHVPIIALTAHAREPDRARCLEAGMDAFVSKPFREEELVSTIQRLLVGRTGKATKPGDRRIVFDRDTALARSSGDPDLLAELAELFLEEAPQTMSALAAAIEASDAKSVQKLSHRLKGALLVLAAGSAARVALELEERASAGNLDGGRDLLDRLAKELDELRPELLALVPEQKAR